jgi:hypothetical protein
MRGMIAVLVAVAVMSVLTLCLTPALAQDTLVLVKDIDRVEHLNLLEKLWKAVDNATEKSLTSHIDWPELKTSPSFLGGVTVVHFSDTGFEDDGAIEAPVGYTICHATIREPSVTCNGWVTAEYRTAADPDSKKVDGLHYNVTFEKPKPTSEKPNPTIAQPPPGKCWLYGTMVVTFVLQSKRSTFKCGQTGTVAFHYGNNDAKKDGK